MSNPLLEVRNASRTFRTGVSPFSREAFTAVDDVSLRLENGRTLGIVGESGVGEIDAAPDGPTPHSSDLRRNLV